MAYTMQQVVDMGRIPLNDDAKTRMSDATGLTFAKQALQMLVIKRPDLFFGQYLAMPDISALVLGSNFPVEDRIAPAVADFITAKAETANDESIVEQRATMFFQLVRGQL